MPVTKIGRWASSADHRASLACRSDPALRGRSPPGRPLVPPRSVVSALIPEVDCTTLWPRSSSIGGGARHDERGRRRPQSTRPAPARRARCWPSWRRLCDRHVGLRHRQSHSSIEVPAAQPACDARRPAGLRGEAGNHRQAQPGAHCPAPCGDDGSVAALWNRRPRPCRCRCRRPYIQP